MAAAPVPLIVRRPIRAAPEQVFEAFADAAALSAWFVPSAEVGIDVLAFDFVVGGGYRFRYTMPDHRQAVVSGVYQEIVPASRIAVSWIWEAPDPLAGVPMHVSFDFHPRNPGTEVVITHTGIPSDRVCTVHEAGWEGTCDGLETYLGLR